jgi:hypothetical protein
MTSRETVGSKRKARIAAWQKIKIKGPAVYRTKHPCYDVMLSIVKQHNNYHKKSAQGIKGFHIRPNQRYAADLQCAIIKHDDTEEVISITNNTKYSMAETGRSLKDPIFQRVMRNTVSDQTLAHLKCYHKPGVTPCDLCSVPIPWGGAHVDHVIPFHTLLEDFVSHNGPQEHPYVSVVDESGADIGGTTLHPLDATYQKNWRTYHRVHAQLRLLCHSCNLKRGGKRD